MSVDRIKGRIVFMCDMCDDHLETEATDFSEANAYRRRNGWGARQNSSGEWEHACTECAWNPVR